MPTKSPEINKPFGVTILIWMVLSLAGWSFVRLGASISQWEILAEFAPKPGPLYIALSGAFWILVSIPTAWALWRRKFWARTAVMLAAPAFAGWYWFDRLVLQNPRPSWPFALSTTILLLLLIIIIIFNQRIILYFTERDT